ncbi:MAG: bifunctional diaminohydroxyphosphoribosylaminopyrimidine deaminase/5-amino-6-(5-phosphoribosylamino)uracil reductase RibD [Deltaproteobacteria bacterium]|nr:bifunctional diaminohydroxyphosphoribosylaminopyrimidine deaminase/5-amino-6-(5-phosphoribosylamino)uracil reductase RibD [Deltaproteobacteria bacterium]
MPHEAFMRAALRLAKKGLGRTSPNPAVGVVIVKRGRVIGKGYHRKAGLPHAEIEALGSANDVKGGTLYVTLEPCRHFGRTPPCTEAIIASGIKKVVVGAVDPNPLVRGKGIARLKKAGVAVTSGVLEDECSALNEAYNYYITTGLPFVTLKLASTLDGRIATSKGESQWITGVEARKVVHRMRSLNDAVMIGSGTALKDDPALTVRLIKGRNPIKALLDSAFKTPLSAKVFGNGRVIVFTTRKAPKKKLENARRLGAEVIIAPSSSEGVDTGFVMKELGKREVTSVLAEGGGRLAASLLRRGLVSKAAIFLSPKFLGNDAFASVGALGLKRLKDAPALKEIKGTNIGGDILVEGYIK